MKNLRLITFPLIMVLASCDFSPAALQASAKTSDSLTLDENYYVAGPNNPLGHAAFVELSARNVIPTKDWSEIDQHEIAIGMGTDEVIASWGQPTDINTTTTAQGEDDQWVYRHCDTCSSSYVYFANGSVSSIQN